MVSVFPRKYLDVSGSGRYAHCTSSGERCTSNRTPIPSFVNRTASCKARHSTKMTMVFHAARALYVQLFKSIAARSAGVIVPSRLTFFNFVLSSLPVNIFSAASVCAAAGFQRSQPPLPLIAQKGIFSTSWQIGPLYNRLCSFRRRQCCCSLALQLG